MNFLFYDGIYCNTEDRVMVGIALGVSVKNIEDLLENVTKLEEMGYVLLSQFLIQTSSYLYGVYWDNISDNFSYGDLFQMRGHEKEILHESLVAAIKSGDNLSIDSLFINKADISVAVSYRFVTVTINNANLFKQPATFKERITTIYKNIYFLNNIPEEDKTKIESSYESISKLESTRNIARHDISILNIEGRRSSKKINMYNSAGNSIVCAELSFMEIIDIIKDKEFLYIKSYRSDSDEIYIDPKNIMNFARPVISTNYGDINSYELRSMKYSTLYCDITEAAYNKLLVELRKLYSEDTVAAWILLGELGE